MGEETISRDRFLSSPGFHSYQFSSKIVSEINNTGVENYSLDTNIFGDDTKFTPAVAPRPGVWDFQPLISKMQMILNQNPNARFVLRVYAGAPDWYKDQVPDALDAYSDGCTYIDSKRDSSGHCVTNRGQLAKEPKQGRRVSIFSSSLMGLWKTGIDQLQVALRQANLESTVDGFTLTGMNSQEWIWPDANFTSLSGARPMVYGRVHRDAYKQWRASRYGIALEPPAEKEFKNFLSQNFGGSAFVDLSTSANVVHYFQFRSEATAKVIVELAAALKQRFSGKKVGAIYGYMNEMGGDPSYGHNALAVLLDSPSIDFINPMSSYIDRHLGGADFERQPYTSVQIRNKMVVNDLDQGTHVSQQNYLGLCDSYKISSDPELQEHYRLYCPSGDPENRYSYIMSQLGFRLSADGQVLDGSLFETVSNFRRFLGFTLAKNIRFNFLSLHNSQTPGSERSFLSDPSLLATAIPQMVSTQRHSFEINAVSNAQILVVSDEDSNNFIRHWQPTVNVGDRSQDVWGLGGHALATPLIALNKMGAPYDHVLLRDLNRLPAQRYKLVIFLNAWNISSDDRVVIAQKFKKERRVLVFNQASGLFKNGIKQVTNISEVVGINIANAVQIRAPSVIVSPNLFPLFQHPYEILPRYHSDCCDLLYAADATASVLGKYQELQNVSMAIKQMDDHSTIWSATLAFPPAAFRDLARFAGVHVYNDVDEPTYVNSAYISLVAKSSGFRLLKFPFPVDIYEAISNQLIRSNVQEFSFEVQVGEVPIFRYQPTRP